MTKLTSKEIVDLSKEYTFFSWSVQGQANPIPVEKAEGIYFWDTDGKRYIDFSSQLMNTNIGHQHPKVVKAIQDQAAKLCFVHPGNTTDVRAQLGHFLGAGSLVHYIDQVDLRLLAIFVGNIDWS